MSPPLGEPIVIDTSTRRLERRLSDISREIVSRSLEIDGPIRIKIEIEARE